MRPFALLLAACYTLHTQAQELLPNGGFEQFGLCPEFMGQVDRATGWLQPTMGSTDFFHACQGAPNSMGVPTNLFGEQAAHGGNGYAGIISFSGPDNTGPSDNHEYLTHPLAAPMVPGETYTVEFFVNLSEISKYAVNDLGALFTMQPPHRDDVLTIAGTPQVTNSAGTLLDDEEMWMRVQGCMQADSAYAFITIGNFRTGAATGYAEVNMDVPSWFTYYFVDDVSVQHVEQPDLGLGPDLTICEATTISVAEPLPGADYLWSTGATGPSITVDAAGTYTVQLAGAECPLADTVVVRLGAPVTFGLAADTLVDFCATRRILLDALPQPPDADLRWSTGANGPITVVDAAGTYLVHAEAVDHCGASASITVIDGCEAPVYAPNAFTPNGDGINDLWRPIWSANAGAALEWTIYDRWGQALFSASAPDTAWDGTVAGEAVPNGSYTWRGHAQDPATAFFRELTGHVVLVR
ncbi:MAG TPA: T9SS type B sorting domain-containing protein [Flavobacteriales bacterium]|jgi:gliding motility-associated-like protein|nr:T9SS type B sorting domain-containing protein [Flavobacteriales bacterium]